MRNAMWVGGGITGIGGIPMLGTGARGLTTLVRYIFRKGEQGFFYDPNDLSAKIKWRRNLLTETEFRNGLNDSSIRAGALSPAAFAGLTTGTGIQVDTATGGTWLYKLATYKEDTPYTFSCYVRMLDGTAPKFGRLSSDTTADIALVIKSVAVQAEVQNLGDGLYRAYGTINSSSVGGHCGVVKYQNNSSKPVIVSGFQLEEGSHPTEYQAFTDFNTEFLRKFPLHTLYQDAVGSVPVVAEGQPIGLILDKSKGLALGANYLNTDTLDFTDGWSSSAGTTSKTKNSITVTGSGGCYRTIEGMLKKAVRIRLKGRCGVQWTLRNSGNNNGEVRVPAGEFDVTAISPDIFKNSSSLYFLIGGSSTLTLDSISIDELKGNHAYQATSASRPLLNQKPILGSDIAQGKEWVGSSVNNLTEKLADGRYRLTTKSTTASRMGMSLPLVAGRTYNIEIDVEATGLPVIVRTFTANYSEIGSVVIGSVPANTRTVLKSTFTATDVTFNVGASMSSNIIDMSFILGSVSVKEVTGYSTDQNHIAYDGVDDKLITNLPAPLTNATVLRAIPNVGAEVKYNQSLPMLYEDSTNHSGLIAIDRALTRFEQLHLMTELDKKAGATSLETLTFKTFDNNQEGFVYDPNDLSTMYQDAAGTVPVTSLGQPVGLILDKKNPALVGGEVDVDVTNWLTSGGITKVNKNTFSNPAAATGLFYDGSAIDGLKIIELHYTTTGGTVQICDALGARVRAESTQPSGVLKATFYPDRASSPLGRIYFRFPTAGTTLVIDKLIVHTYTGNHAFQTSSASRPILRKNAMTGANYLEFDGIDDRLTTKSFPSMGAATTLFVGSLGNRIGTSAIAGRNVRGYLYQSVSNVAVQSVNNPIGVPIDGKTVITAKYAASGTGLTLKVNDVTSTNNLTTDRGYSTSNPLTIGAFNSEGVVPFGGHIYSLIGIAKVVSDDESAAIEKELAKRTGVTLNV